MVDGALVDYNINIENMSKFTTSGSLSNVVKEVTVQTNVTGSDVSGSIHSSLTHIHLLPIASSSFVAFDSLTEANVKAWVTSSTGWSTYLSDLESCVSESLWPNETHGLPW